MSPLARLIFIIIIAVLIYYFLPYTIPFLLALTFAVLLEPIVLFMQRFLKLKRMLSVIIAYLLFLLTFLGLLVLTATKITFEFMALLDRFPALFADLQHQLPYWLQQGQLIYEDLPPEAIESVHKGFQSAIEWANGIMKATVSFMLGLASGIPKLLIQIVIILVATFLISLHLPRLGHQFLDLFSERSRGKVAIVLSDLNSAVVGFVRAQFLISFLTYLLTLIGLLIIGVKYAITIALIITIVDILPILGTGSVIVPWAVYLYTINDYYTATGLLVLYVVIIIFRRIVEPKILGDRIGLSALATIISMYLGFEILGGLGLVMGPLLFILFNAVRKAGLLKIKLDF